MTKEMYAATVDMDVDGEELSFIYSVEGATTIAELFHLTNCDGAYLEPLRSLEPKRLKSVRRKPNG